MRKTLLIVLAVIVLLVAASALLLPLLIDKDKVLALAAREVQQQTGATLTVDGQASLSLFPVIGVSLGDVALAMPGEQKPGVQVEAVQIGIQVLPLLRGNVQIDTLSLQGLNARLVSAPEQEPAIDTSNLTDAQLDAFYSKRRSDMAAAGETAGAEAVLAVPLALNVQQLRVRDTHLEMIDQETGEANVIELPRLDVSGLNLDGRAIPLSLQLHIPGEQPVSVNLDGRVRIEQSTQNLHVDEMQVTVNGATAAPLELNTTGSVDLARQIADLQLQLKLGNTEGEGTLRYAAFESPQIDTALHLNQLDPALLVLAGPDAAAADATAEDDNTSADQPLPLDAIRLIDTRADLRIDRAMFNVHVVQQLHARLRAVDGTVELSTVTGQLHGGKLDLKATFDGKHNVAKLDTRGGLANLDIAKALAAMQSRPLVTGSTSLHWQLHSAGRSSAELVSALTGPIQVSSDSVTLKGLGVQKMLCQGVALVNKEALQAQFPADSPFDALRANIVLGGGSARLSPLSASLAGVSLTGKGAADLDSQAFKATFTAKLSPALEKLDPACRVSKRLVAVDWPVKCKGQLAGDPAQWCSVDTEKIIADLARYEVQHQVQKKAGKFFDQLLK